ncbi:MAG TPA: translation initiation factor IF-1 [Candidatus Dojkabacteria bacterium]|nr:translation initiation factor IF-1 [Candidatus Dojkabacteria bacterium]HQF36609.1 translation initiation factor IF-1 [Candidatus Dojkabacteria bacterium]
MNQVFEIDGTVVEAHPEMKFVVELDVCGQKKKILSRLSGKIKMNYIKVVVGDKVKVEVSSCDPTKGRIIYRYKP